MCFRTWPDRWNKQRLLNESLMALEFQGQMPAWADVRKHIESLFEGITAPPAYWPQNFSEHLRDINQRRMEILELWQESLRAKAKLEKAGIGIPPPLLTMVVFSQFKKQLRREIRRFFVSTPKPLSIRLFTKSMHRGLTDNLEYDDWPC